MKKDVPPAPPALPPVEPKKDIAPPAPPPLPAMKKDVPPAPPALPPVEPKTNLAPVAPALPAAPKLDTPPAAPVVPPALPPLPAMKKDVPPAPPAPPALPGAKDTPPKPVELITPPENKPEAKLPPAPSAVDAELSKSLSMDKTPSKPADAKPADAKASAADAKKATLVVNFKTTETSVPLTYKSELDKIISRVKANDKERVSILAYASSVGDQPSTARRVSLSRALSVRAYLIDAGISNMRINVQAEGDKNPGGNPDRVDVFVQSGDGK